MIQDECYQTDYNTLDDPTLQEEMKRLLLLSAENSLQTNYQYMEKYALIPECNNRFAFLGAFAWVWFCFAETYRTCLNFAMRMNMCRLS